MHQLSQQGRFLIFSECENQLEDLLNPASSAPSLEFLIRNPGEGLEHLPL